VLKAFTGMLGENTHIEYYKFRPVKHLCVYALQDKVIISLGVKSYQKGFIDIAIAEFQNIHDLTRRFELFCSSCQIFQRLASFF
jgi:hypothetical protein